MMIMMRAESLAKVNTSCTLVAHVTSQLFTKVSTHIQTAARRRTASSGGSHSGKNGFVAYTANVRATIAWLHGLTRMHSTHKRINARKRPKVTII